jgi:uroporphyrinogen III methyltransferase / synthase
MPNQGRVYLIGAGVGNQDYLTLRGRELLLNAEIVIYDALVDESLLDLVSENCLKLSVGKRGGEASTPQAKTNQLLVAYCLQGKQVVRLKSGDPFVFGRATEEISALQAAGCNFEVVPGISSALAAPLLAGIPLTDKYLSSCFAVVSAHQPELLNWEALSKIDTLVILMGGRSLETIRQKLIVNQRSPKEPVAIICNAGRLQQIVFHGNLANIGEKIQGVDLSPAVIVIGKVVELSYQFHQTLIEDISSPTPLEGQNILVTRAAEQSSKFTELLQKQGAKVVEMPALEITTPSSWLNLDRAIARINEFQWLILTSANAVNYFFDRLAALGKDARVLFGVKIAVVGRKTADVLGQRQIKPDFIPPEYVADSLVTNFPEPLTNQKILFPRVETGGREVLVKELSIQEAEVIEVAAYQSKCPEKIDQATFHALQQKQIDIITFASSKTVSNFYQLIQQQLPSSGAIQSLLENVRVASIGPQTSKTCQELLGRVDFEAKEYTLEGLTTAIVEGVAVRP